MATNRTISIRLGLEGALELRQQLEAAGNTGGAALDKLRSGIERLGAQSTSQVEAALDRLAAKAAETQAKVGQTQANAFAGVKPLTNDADLAKLQSSYNALGASMDAARAKYDPLFAASKRYSDQFAEIEDLQAKGVLTAGQAQVAQQRLTAEYARASVPLKDMASSSGAAAASARNMGIQFVQGISGIATGQPILTTFIQQGHQVVDTSLAMGTGIKGTADAFKGMIAGIGGLPTLLAVGVVGAFAAVSAAAISGASRLADIRASLRATQDGYTGLADTVDATARRVAASSSLALAAATQAAQSLAGAKYFAGTGRDLEELTRLAADLGRTMGGDAASGAKTLRDLMDDTSKAAHSLADQGFRSLTPEVLRYIDAAQAGGDRSKAFSAALAAIGAVAKGAANDVDPVTKAWRDLGNALTSSSDGFKPIKDYLVNELAQAIRDTIYLVDTLAAAWKGLKSILPGGLSLKDGADIYSGGSGIGGGPAVPSVGAAPGASVQTNSATKDAFIANWLSAATAAGQQLGVSPQTILGHWGQETGWGRNIHDNNPGNIQAGSGYTGATVVRGDTHADGSAYQTQFRAYATPEDFARDYASLIQRKYTGAVGTGNDAMAYGQALRAGGYMENPNGARDIANAAASVRLPEGMLDNTRALADTLGKATENARAFTEVKLSAELAATGQRMGQLIDLGQQDSAEFAALKQRSEELTAARHKNVDAETEAQRAAASSLRSTEGLTDGERGLAAAIEARRQVAVNAGLPFGTEQQQQATVEYLAKQSQAAEQLAASLVQTRLNSDAMTKAYGQGNEAVAEATAKQQALLEVQRLFPNSVAQQNGAMAALTQVYKDVAASAAAAGVAQQNAQSRDNLAYISTETSTIGLNADQRTKLLAVMKAEQDMHRKFGDVLPQEAQDYITLTARTADATAAFNQQKAAMDELSGFISNTFDTISNSITSAFASGQLSAVKFGDIAKSVANAVLSEFIKLAAINPLKNALFGTTSPTHGSVGGVLGNLFGNGSGGAGEAATLAAAASSVTSAFDGKGVSADAAGNIASTSSGTLGTLGGVASLASSANSLTGGSLLGSIGSGAGIAGLATSFFGNATQATNIALDSLGTVAGQAVQGVATAGQVATASIANGLGLGNGAASTLTSAVSSIGSYLPAIGAGIGVITNLVKGNYLGAATVAAGAAIGSIIPGVGTAIGAALGGLLGSFFGGGHPKNPYSSVAVDVQNGQLATGKVVSQILDPTAARTSVDAFTSGVNDYLRAARLTITNDSGRIGGVGTGIKGFEQVDDPAKLFQVLRFGPDSTVDPSSNFYRAEQGALAGQSYSTPQLLQDDLQKIAGFADGLDNLGLHLASVGAKLTNIQIASVDPARRNGDAIGLSDGSKLPDQDFRTALSNDLTKQTFANVDALNAEIAKVSEFVGSTMPSLTNPVFETTSALMKQIGDLNKTYADAIQQAKDYGLATDDLTKAQGKAIELLQEPARKQLALSNLGIQIRGATARGESTADLTLQQFDLQAQQQRDALAQQFKDIYGSLVAPAKEYAAASAELDKTLSAERLNTQRQLNDAMVQAERQAAAQRTAAIRALGDAQDAVNDAFFGIRARQATLNGDTQGADLINYDAKAAQESKTYARQLVDFYGDSFYMSQDYQNRMSELETVHQQERLAIVKKGGTDANNVLAQAQTSASNVLSSLADYARKLQTGTDSPLSATTQYANAVSQFNAVSSAAAAGDYRSASKLSSFADTLLSTSRSVNGSGAGYAADFDRVISALQGVADVGTDALTASAMLDIQQQANAPVVSAIQSLQDEVKALRREVQLQNVRLA